MNRISLGGKSNTLMSKEDSGRSKISGKKHPEPYMSQNLDTVCEIFIIMSDNIDIHILPPGIYRQFSSISSYKYHSVHLGVLWGCSQSDFQHKMTK